MRPFFIALFTACCLFMLGTACAFFPEQGIAVGSLTIRMPNWEQLSGNETTTPTEEMSVAAVPVAEETIVTNDTIDTVVVKEPTDYDYMQPFYASLAASDTTSIRVVHYGDSQLEGDRMTIDIRRALQKRYGGGGVGIIPLHQTIGSQCLNQTLYFNDVAQAVNQGPKRYLAYGPKDKRRENKVYGPMAQVAVMNDSLVAGSENVRLYIATYKKGTEAYFNRIRVLRDGKDSLVTVRDSTWQYNLRLQGKGDIYGVSLETDRGVIVDNIPMRGCAGTIFTQMDRRALKHYFQVTRTRLIIMQYGGNVMPYTSNRTQIDNYAKRVRAQLRYMKACAPDAAILFVGPSDMLTSINGNKQSYPLLPAMDAALRETAHNEGAAYWSLFEAMGGSGAMNKWMQQGLAAGDGVHFTRKGASRAGQLLADWIMEGAKTK